MFSYIINKYFIVVMSLKAKKKDIQCLNCGCLGHTSKVCNSPTTSYGVVCFKLVNDDIKYLMIQRKDSLCYVEFVRGNYKIGNKNYITRLFERMTIKEKQFLLNNKFEKIWRDLWSDNRKNNNLMKSTKLKYDMLKTGYNILMKDKTTSFFSLSIVVENTSNSSKSKSFEQEWEFPKGRRKLGESDVDCAVREFSEESNIKENDIHLIDRTKAFEEIYVSMNKIRYRNVLYLGRYMKKNNINHYDKNNLNQSKEVRDVKWFTQDVVHEKIKDRNKEKAEMFHIANDAVKKYILKQNV